MNEDDLLDEIFGDKKTWRGHKLSWCNQCETFSITLNCCGNGSCTGGGCNKCCGPDGFDSIDFTTLNKHCIEDYLNEEENKTLKKIRFLKKYIPICLSAGFYEISWKYLHEKGELCSAAYDLFDELKEFKDF